MSILERVRPVLGYRTLPTTILLVLIYLIALVAIFVTDELDPVPHAGSKKLKWLDLKQAWGDLEHVRRPPEAVWIFVF